MVRSIGPLTIGEIAWIAAITLVLPLSLWLLVSVSSMPAQPAPQANGIPLVMHRLDDGWLIVTNRQRKMVFREASIMFMEYTPSDNNLERPGFNSVSLGTASGKSWRVDVNGRADAQKLLEFVLNQPVPDENR